MLWESCVKEKRYDEHGLDVFEGNTGTDNSQSALTEENALRMIGLAGGRREFEGFVTAARQLGLYWTVLNEPPEPSVGGKVT